MSDCICMACYLSMTFIVLFLDLNNGDGATNFHIVLHKGFYIVIIEAR